MVHRDLRESDNDDDDDRDDHRTMEARKVKSIYSELHREEVEVEPVNHDRLVNAMVKMVRMRSCDDLLSSSR